MKKASITALTFSVMLFAVGMAQNSFALGDYDFLTSWGSFGISEEGKFSHPQYLTVDSQGNVYVTDLGNKRVQKFSSTGEFQTMWGSSGKLPGQFHYPSGIAVGDNSVFVADRDLHRIQKFDLSGNYVSEWGTKGIYEGQFLFPNGITVSNNFVYVVDTGNQRIQKFTTDGEFVLSFGKSGTQEGQFLTALDIDADSEGNLYVADRGNGKIEKFDADGNHLKSLKYYGSNYVFSPIGITLDSDDNLFVINSATDKILHLGQDSTYLSIFDQKGPFSYEFEMPHDLKIGVNGELFVIDSVSHKIKLFETESYVAPEIIEIENIDEPEIQLKDYEKPKITAPPNMTVEATGILTHVDFGEAVATDESGIKTILSNAPDGGFPLGITNIMWIAFDNAGNSEHAYQTITVNACGKFYSEYNGMYGTSGDDIIQGTNLNDLIFALDGNDLVNGGLGDDCIFGGTGDDILYGNEGNDTLYGNEGDDILKGFSGDDVLIANEGQNVGDGGEGNDYCYFSSDELILNCN